MADLPGLASPTQPAEAAAERARDAITRASPFLSRLLATDPLADTALGDLDRQVALGPLAEDAAGLARWKRLEMLRIAARDLLAFDGVEAVGAALAALAGRLCTAAAELAGTTGIAVIAMGKLGASELNYSSDIDLVLAGEGDARPLLDILRRCWRVDLGLRPEGRDGPVVRSLASFEVYWDRWAQTWEFQALLKARPVAGDLGLGARFIEAAHTRLWNRPFGADELREVRAMKQRTERQVARRSYGATELKYGPGGIRDVEFALQLLQMVHGRADPSLRAAGTLPALAALAAGGYVSRHDAAKLGDAYRFLRTVEHRLQLWEDQQVHAVPAGREARTRLARILGYRDDRQDTALAHFDRYLRSQQAVVRPIHERLFFRPLLEAFSAGAAAGLSEDAASERLSAFGFSDARRTRHAIAELTQGFSRSSTLLGQLLPLLLDWLSAAPNPDLGLLGLRSLTTVPHNRQQLAAVCRESPAAARQLCTMLGTGPSLVRDFQRYPDALAGLADGHSLADRSAADLRRGAQQAITWREGPARLAALQRFAGAERLRIAARDVLGVDDVAATGRALAALAEAVLAAAMELAGPQIPFAVIGMGRLGGTEMAYGSDLDLLFVYDAPAGRRLTAEDAREAERVATALLRLIGGETPAARIFAVDTGLRPEGRMGPLARSVDAYRAYYERWAAVWERQALLRGRVVAGDPEAGERFTQIARHFVWGAPLLAEEVREIRRIKARMERERIPAGEDPQFHLKLGRGSLSDIEWTAQLLQLRHGVAAAGTADALEALTRSGVLGAGDAAVLLGAHRFCEAARNRLHLVRGAPGDALPATGALLSILARSLATTPSGLRDAYRRHTRRARQVVERVFYRT